MVSKIRTDNRQDSDRPHYYSQFWIDVAMGKQSPALPEAPATAEEEEEGLEPDILAAAPKPEPKKAAKPAEKKPEARPTITSLADLANIDMLMRSSAAMDDEEAPDISAGLGAEAGPDITLDVVNAASPADEEEETVEGGFEEGFEEEEEEDEWGGGRRKSKPGKAKRHERREF